MKVLRYAIVPAGTEQQAIERAHSAFENLCRGEFSPYKDADRRAVYERYTLLHDTPDSDTGVWSTASPEAVDRLQTAWDEMIEELREIHEGDDNTFSPGTHNRTRKYRIYDQHGGAVVCGHRFRDLIESDDHWIVAAQCSF